MEPNPNLKLGTIVQINPELCPQYAGQFVIVTEVLSFGIQGYFALVFPCNNLTRFKDVAYIRLNWEKIEAVGLVYWELHTKNDGKSDDHNDNQYNREK